MNETYDGFARGVPASEALPAERAAFIRKTYLHLAGAIAVFAVLTGFIVASPAGYMIASTFLGTKYSWLIVLGAFMGVSWLAQSWASSGSSRGMQYAGLGLYTVAEAIIFVPMLYVVSAYSGVDVIAKAGIVTIGLFLGLTAVVFLTKHDFSFLRPILAIGGFVALGYIASAILFGFSIGGLFAFIMVGFAGGSILYSTSDVLHRYRTDQHVAASLALFAGIALLFWYILSIFSRRD
ncbi:MAG: Bax inhibitor-1 family protein [Pyrinomonadaceae bacterium]